MNTENQKHEHRKSKAASPEECYPSPPKPIGYGWEVPHGQLNYLCLTLE